MRLTPWRVGIQCGELAHLSHTPMLKPRKNTENDLICGRTRLSILLDFFGGFLSGLRLLVSYIF
jgi:hypothetical protein